MRLPVLALAAALLASPAAAFDINAMTPDEKDAFGEAVRDYLLQNPDVLLEIIDVIEQQRADAQVDRDKALIAEHAEAIFNDKASFVGGNPDGDITIVEFLDYKCGYCKRAFPEMEALLKADGNIRFVIKEFPVLGEESVLAARFAIAVKALAGDEAYSRVHDQLMAFRGNFTPETLDHLATAQGIDLDALHKQMADPATEAVIIANHQLADALGITGTPGFVMGEKLLRGYLPPEAMSQLVAGLRS